MTQEKALKILKTGKNAFLTGEPGSGKSYTINSFTKYLREAGISYAVTASTGIAATHIGGITIHSWSGIGIKEKITDIDLVNITEKKFVVERIQRTKVLIVDEVSMLGAETINNIDKVLRYVKNFMSNAPFGGMQVVFVGDFFQLPPVVKDGKKAEFAFESPSWADANPVYCYLHEQHRQEDKNFLKILTAIRQGKVTEDHRKRLIKQSTTDDFVTRLFTHNADVDTINTTELAHINEQEILYKMTQNGNEYLCDYLKKNCMSPENLRLKIGAVVMFTKNLFEDGEAIYVNGTLGKVVGYSDMSDSPIVETKDGKRIIAKSADWSIEENGLKKATITQIPLRLAWAITVHKSQGMSLDSAAIDLSKAFEYGQGYVAISRVRSLDGLFLSGLNKNALSIHPKVVKQDIIFREESDLIDQQY